MSTPTLELRMSPRHRTARSALALALALPMAAGCGYSEQGKAAASRKPESASSRKAESAEGKTAGIRVVRPEQRDLRMTVVQPGTIQAFEVTPVYSRIAGYVEKYRFNIGDRVKTGDVLIDMWVPDLVEAHQQKSAAVRRAEVQIEVTQSSLQAAESNLRTAESRIVSARAGVKRAQASYTRWESEYKRLQTLVGQRVLDVQVRDETYRQFEEAAAARDQAEAMVAEMTSARDKAAADRDKARVDVEAARADLEVAKANEREAKVLLDYGQIKAPYPGIITQRNVSPGDYLQPGGGSNGRPLFVLEQNDPVRIFVGVPELASYFIHEGDTALIRFQAIPGITREGKVVRTGFSLNPSTRTLQTEIDLPNPDGHLHPGWYVTVTITVDRKQVWTLPSDAIGFHGQQNYFVYLEVDGKPVRTPVIVGPSDDTHIEILRKYAPGANTYDWPRFDGTERVLAGNLDVLAAGQPAPATGSKP
jgi:RND family efflux transporter MFP subunit